MNETRLNYSKPGIANSFTRPVKLLSVSMKFNYTVNL